MTEKITEPAAPMIEETSDISEPVKLTELQQWERAQLGYLCTALGFGGSTVIMLAEVTVFDEVRNGSILMIGICSFVMFMLAIASHNKAKKSSREAL
jgi:hypothetical protein